jgi:hypothetical protein
LIGADALLTTAEVGVAFAGFASVVTVFQRREDGDWSPPDVIRFQLMIATSLSAVLFAMLPFAFSFLGVEEAALWATCSALFAIYLTVMLVLVARRSLPLVSTSALSPLVAWPSLGGGILAIVLQILNSASFLLHRELGAYFIGLLYLLVLCGVSFARLLPVGRARTK